VHRHQKIVAYDPATIEEADFPFHTEGAVAKEDPARKRLTTGISVALLIPVIRDADLLPCPNPML
jgi:hypothetical protein